MNSTEKRLIKLFIVQKEEKEIINI